MVLSSEYLRYIYIESESVNDKGKVHEIVQIQLIMLSGESGRGTRLSFYSVEFGRTAFV